MSIPPLPPPLPPPLTHIEVCGGKKESGKRHWAHVCVCVCMCARARPEMQRNILIEYLVICAEMSASGVSK